MIALVGATPVCVTIDPVTYNIGADRIEEAITKNTRGIVAVSLYGQCPEMEAILSVAGEYGLFVIEDGAQSVGAERNGRRACGLAPVGARPVDRGRRSPARRGGAVGGPAVSPGATHVFAQYTIRTPRRDDLAAHLRENGVPTAVHYPIPLHLQDAFRGLGYEKGGFPESEATAGEGAVRPMSAFLSEADQDEGIRQGRGVFSG